MYVKELLVLYRIEHMHEICHVDILTAVSLIKDVHCYKGVLLFLLQLDHDEYRTKSRANVNAYSDP